jgi:hypothetical protein
MIDHRQFQTFFFGIDTTLLHDIFARRLLMDASTTSRMDSTRWIAGGDDTCRFGDFVRGYILAEAVGIADVLVALSLT